MCLISGSRGLAALWRGTALVRLTLMDGSPWHAASETSIWKTAASSLSQTQNESLWVVLPLHLTSDLQSFRKIWLSLTSLSVSAGPSCQRLLPGSDHRWHQLPAEWPGDLWCHQPVPRPYRGCRCHHSAGTRDTEISLTSAVNLWTAANSAAWMGYWTLGTNHECLFEMTDNISFGKVNHITAKRHKLLQRHTKHLERDTKLL